MANGLNTSILSAESRGYMFLCENIKNEPSKKAKPVAQDTVRKDAAEPCADIKKELKNTIEKK